MPKIHLRLFALVFISACTLAARIASADDPTPVRGEEVLARIAGNALPGDVVHVIAQNKLAFTPDDSYLAPIEAIGANDSTMVAAAGAS